MIKLGELYYDEEKLDSLQIVVSDKEGTTISAYSRQGWMSNQEAFKKTAEQLIDALAEYLFTQGIKSIEQNNTEKRDYIA